MQPAGACPLCIRCAAAPGSRGVTHRRRSQPVELLVRPHFVVDLARAVPGAVLPSTAEGQADDDLRAVVALALLEDAVARVGDVTEGEAAAQAGHVDPLLDVRRRVDVRPPHRGADHLAPLARVRVARRVHPMARRALQARIAATQVPEAVRDLGPAPYQPLALSAPVETPELEAGGPVELPVVEALVPEGVAQAGTRAGRDV